jgi:hypothetical protein
LPRFNSLNIFFIEELINESFETQRMIVSTKYLVLIEDNIQFFLEWQENYELKKLFSYELIYVFDSKAFSIVSEDTLLYVFLS